jgi:FKBP-type peptidyl-prolyl cis-trans isomerase
MIVLRTHRALIGAAALVMAFSACRQSKYDGFEESESGLYTAWHDKHEDAPKAKMGDIMFTTMKLYRKGAEEGKDSLLFDSFQSPDIPGGLKLIELMKPLYSGDLMEGLAELHLGDSASFITSADSFFIVANKMPELPPGIKKGDALLFRFRVKDIKTMDETKEYVNNLRSKSMAENQKGLNELQASEQERMMEYINRKNITEKPTASGLYVIVTDKGTGPKPKKGQMVSVQYTGYLLNGKKFDSSLDHGAPIEFKLGEGQVIAGWEEGISLLNVGTSATLIIPSVLGYGSNGSGEIPPFSPLIFDIQLLNAK